MVMCLFMTKEKSHRDRDALTGWGLQWATPLFMTGFSSSKQSRSGLQYVIGGQGNVVLG